MLSLVGALQLVLEHRALTKIINFATLIYMLSDDRGEKENDSGIHPVAPVLKKFI